MRNLLSLAIIFATLAASGQTVRNDTRSDRNIRQYGGIIQGDTARKRIALVFTAAAWADGADTIINTMKSRGVKGSFFFTGGFYEKFPGIIARLVKDGHYVGSHGYAHLLYAPWGSKRDSTIVSKEEFELAQAVIRGGEKNPKRNLRYYPLKGLVCCGNCKRTLTRRKLRNEGGYFF